MSTYRVTAGYVTVQTAVPGGRAMVDVPRGADLPDDVPDEQRNALLALGHVVPARVELKPAPSPPAGPPPRGGPGSGADAWAAYANAHGVHVPDGANRDQIRALLVEHNIPVE